MPDYNEQTVLTREMVDRLMRVYTGTDGMMYQGMPGVTTAEYAEYQDYDPPAHAPVFNIPRSFTFSIPASEVNPGWWELFTSGDTDGQDPEPEPEPDPEPDPEPCTEEELLEFLKS